MINGTAESRALIQTVRQESLPRRKRASIQPEIDFHIHLHLHALLSFRARTATSVPPPFQN